MKDVIKTKKRNDMFNSLKQFKNGLCNYYKLRILESKSDLHLIKKKRMPFMTI